MSMKSMGLISSPIIDTRFDFRPELIPAPRWAKALLFAFAGAVHLIANVVYLAAYGPFSSPGGDLWFFAGVARGTERLFPTDPLQVLLPILGFLSAPTICVLLVLLSNALHLFTLWLMLGALVEFFNDEWAAIWSCAFFTLTLASGFLFSTSAFVHQQESLPVAVGLLWSGHLFMMAPTGLERLRWAGVTVALVLLGAILGPECLVVCTLAIPCAVVWHFRRFMDPFIRHAMGTVLLVLYFTTIALSGAYLADAIGYGAQVFRGINLEALREVGLGDLVGMGWKEILLLYGPVYVVLAGLAAWTWSNGRLPELALVFTGVIFATVSSRFFFIAEIGFAALVCWVLARPLRYEPISKHTVGAVMLALMAGYAAFKGVPCAYPGVFVEVVEQIGKDPQPDKLVLCTPTYGPMVRAISAAQPTSDFCRVDPRWVRIATMAAPEAVGVLASKKVTHVFLTSSDFNLGTKLDAHGVVEAAFVSTGGFAPLVNDMPHAQVSASLVHRALLGKEPVPGLTPLKEATHLPTEQRAVLYRVEPAAPEAPPSAP
jgi:hypothetical protein